MKPLLISNLLLGLLMVLPSSAVAQSNSSAEKEIPTIDFCEIVRNPRRYFNQTVRIRAKWESVKGFAYLTEDRCPAKVGNEIAVAVGDARDGTTVTNLKRIRSREYGDQTMITAVGTLLDHGKYRGVYRYHFYIFRLEEVTRAVEQERVRTVDFCNLLKQPSSVLDQPVRVTARWEPSREFFVLRDARCQKEYPVEGVVVLTADQDEAIRTSLSKIQSREFGGRAMVTAVGILSDPTNGEGGFRFHFKILRFEDVAHVVEPYKQLLQAGRTYRAAVRGDKEFGLRLLPPLHVEFHYAVRVEWINLSDFPMLEELRETDGARTIVFSVISDERKQMTATRWNRSIELKIIRLE